VTPLPAHPAARVAALAAALVPQAAVRLLGRLPPGEVEPAAFRAARLASASRAERLRALAGALSPWGAPPVAELARRERPPIAALLGAPERDLGVPALLRRRLQEVRAGSS
jgi:hypothetical protein